MLRLANRHPPRINEMHHVCMQMQTRCIMLVPSLSTRQVATLLGRATTTITHAVADRRRGSGRGGPAALRRGPPVSARPKNPPQPTSTLQPRPEDLVTVEHAELARIAFAHSPHPLPWGELRTWGPHPLDDDRGRHDGAVLPGAGEPASTAPGCGAAGRRNALCSSDSTRTRDRLRDRLSQPPPAHDFRRGNQPKVASEGVSGA